MVILLSIDCVIITAFSNSLIISCFRSPVVVVSSLNLSLWCNCITEFVVSTNCDTMFDINCELTANELKNKNQCGALREKMANETYSQHLQHHCPYTAHHHSICHFWVFCCSSSWQVFHCVYNRQLQCCVVAAEQLVYCW